MATAEKLFTVAGTAAQDGVTKVRFANDLVARIKILTKVGCADINLIELPHAMTKLEALRFLQANGFTEGDAGFAVTAKLAEKSQLAKKGEVKMAGSKVSKPVKAKAKTTVQDVLVAVSVSADEPAIM
jgi:hypothetical protein